MKFWLKNIFVFFIFFQGISVFSQTYERGIPFYAAFDSILPSGHAALADLEKNLIRKDSRNFLSVRRDANTSFNLQKNSLLRLTDFPGQGTSFFNGILAEDCFLFEEPNFKASIQGSLKKGDEIRFNSHQNGFLKISKPDIESHFLNASCVFMPLDFASWIETKDGEIGFFSHRIRDEIFISSEEVFHEERSKVLNLKQKLSTQAKDALNFKNILKIRGIKLSQLRRLSLSDVKDFRTYHDLAIVTQAQSDLGLAVKSYLKVEKEWSRELWVSRLKDHGEVFWTRPDFEDHILSANEIIKLGPIDRVVCHPRLVKTCLVSARGVFLTSDGIQFRRLEMFKDQSYPIAISDDGDLFVGTYISKDAGQSFYPYLDWKELTQISGLNSRSQRRLTIAEILPKAYDRVQIRLDDGVRKHTLTGTHRFSLVRDWVVIR